ncbi:MAG TPA: NAD(P)/FAD-dependent oxidoreductase [Pseudonocardiaceae bacterium]|jgi:2-polyprenyl-6-methoxyphenol hydroxylase-like FAD-dependent oxidoreductase
MTTTHHEIAVIGAGLGGLTFAAVLRRNGIDAAVYDLDATSTARDQGGMLDMHEESGQAALRAAGRFAEFQAVIAPGGEAMRILDRHADVRWADDGEDGNRPEVKRGALRDILLDTSPEGTVRWNAKITGARPLGDGRHEVTLAGGSTFTTDLLVGADGAWSKVRPLVSAAVPEYLGLSFVETHLLDADTRHPASAALIGTGSMFALGDGKGFLAHRDSDGGLHIYIALHTQENWINRFDPATARADLLAHFTGWDERLLALLTDADTELVPRSIHALPVGHRWARTPGVTLIGDAAHLMSPFAGEGANLAMQDGAELAAAIVAHPGDVETALAAYEAEMFPRSEAAAAESAANLAISFRADAPQGMIDQMNMYYSQAT